MGDTDQGRWNEIQIEALIDDARGWASGREGWNQYEFVLGNQLAEALEFQAARLRTVEAERDAAEAQVAAVRGAVYDGKYGGDAEWVSLNVRHIVGRPSARPVPATVAATAPVQSPKGTISWEEHLTAWNAYNRHHPGQSAQRIAERGGFGYGELMRFLRREPKTFRTLDDPERTRRCISNARHMNPLPAALSVPVVEPKEEI